MMARISDSIKTVTGSEPISLAEIKTALGITGSDHDDYLTYLGKAARELCESKTNVSLVDTTIDATIDCQASWVFLPYGPVKGISSIASYYQGTKVKDLVAGTDYYLSYQDNTRLTFIAENHSYEVRITYTTGWTTVPSIVKEVIGKLVAWWYDNPDKVMLYADHAKSVIRDLRVLSKMDTL